MIKDADKNMLSREDLYWKLWSHYLGLTIISLLVHLPEIKT